MKRQIAPVIPQAWEQIENESKSVFEVYLAGRRVIDLDGPHGWTFGAYNTGRLSLFPEDPVKGVGAGLRDVRPLAELRVPMTLDQFTLDTAGRGALLDLEPVADAARRIALAEDQAIFNGWKAAGIEGIIPSSSHKPVVLGRKGYAEAVVEATDRLRASGVEGPYALALGTSAYHELSRLTGEGGYPVRKLIERQVIDGPIVHAPAIEGGVVLSTRGDDFILHLGQDLSIGYASHDKDHVELYITESFTFSVIEPDAAVPLKAR